MKISLPKKVITIFFSVIISLIIVEVFLRIFGIKPWENIITSEPVIYKSDSILGWRVKTGNYIMPPTHKLGKKFRMSFEKNGHRKTREKYNNPKGEILVIGGSFTQGWGVNDEDTFSSKLQKKYTNFKVYNFGQGGYGGVQSLLLLQEQISKMKFPKLVIYGFIEHHESRNVARAQWLRVLAKHSSRGHVKTPYGYIGKNNKLIIHPPTKYINLPMREELALVALFEKIYMKFKTKKRKKQQKIVTQKIILQMKKISNKFGSDFMLIILDWNNRFTKDHYENFLKKNKIKFVNCAVPLTNQMVIPGEYHPSEKAHTYYNECLSSYIKKQKLIE